MGRRWNGWGSDAEDHPLSERARRFLAERIGVAVPATSASREAALQAVGASRLPAATAFQTDPAIRLDHAFGQSTPDWIALRSGRIGRVADGVALPASHAEAVAALDEAKRLGALVIPYGGGTSVVGHLRVPEGDRPVVNISLERLAALQAIDVQNLTARFGAGAPGPAIEAALAAHGMTLGHFPQSFELSTAGGWVVTRSSGQQSLRYGRIEQLFHAGRLATPRGELAVGGLPASSAGPDLREAVLGSEGRLGLLTEVTLRIRPRAAHERFHAIFFPHWDAGLAAVRALAQAGVPLSMLRYANAVETETQLAMVEGHDGALAWLKRYLRWRGVDAGACMLLAGVTGSEREARQARSALGEIAATQRGVAVGTAIGSAWAKNRFRGPYLRNSLWDAGYRGRDDGDLRAVDRRDGDARGDRRRRPGFACRRRRAGPCLHPPLARLSAGLQRLLDLRLSPRRRSRREPRALAAAQDGGVASDRRRRRHDQPPAWRRRRPCALPRGREGRARPGAAARRGPRARSGRDDESGQALAGRGRGVDTVT